ncbi:MAG: aminoacyl-tRNA hydrolase [Ignavibacteria bacterium]|nr:aminoacyl-tRNA hydrolase [Ignavibacteria bacterium]
MDYNILVGLGNPGFEYETTRHNVGFHVIDVLCNRLGKSLRPGKGEYLFASGQVSGRGILLVKPMTYMNNSGTAVGDVLLNYESSPDRLAVVFDDLALPLSTIRIRPKGSDGGHNGLRSIIYHLNTNAFPRIRCGIRQEMMPPKNRVVDFVLSPFDEGEKEAVNEMVERAADAATEFATLGIAPTMNKFNR